MPGAPRLQVLAAAGLILLGGCAATDSYRGPNSSYVPMRSTTQVEEGGFGYLSVGAIAHADFFGEIEGVDPGQGMSLTLPVPPWLFALAALVVVSQGDIDLDIRIDSSGDGTDGDDVDASDLLASGYSDSRRRIISQFSINATLSQTTHRDDEGGTLTYGAFLLGARLAGARIYAARPYFDAGYGWYSLDYTAATRSDANIGGPYLGGGLEFHMSDHVSVALEAKAHLYYGEDAAGELVEGGARQVSIVLNTYW